MPRTLVTYLMMIATAFFWGSNFVVGKFLVDTVQPFTIACLRFGLAALLLNFYVILKKEWTQWSQGYSVWWLVILGLVGTSLANGLVFPALKYTSAINGSLVMSLVPATTALLAFFIFRDPLGWKNVLGLVLSFLGVFLVLTQGQAWGSFSLNNGDLLLLLAMLSGATNYILVKLASKFFPTVTITAGSLTFGTLFLLPFAWQEFNAGQTLDLPLYAWALILYMAIFTTTIGFYFWNEGIKRLGPAKASVFFNLIPIFSVILSALFLQEQVTWVHIMGVFLVVIGIIGTQKR